MLMFQLKRWILFYDILIDMCSYPLHPLNFLIFCRKNPDHHDSRVAMGVRHGPRATQKQQNRYMPRVEYMRKYGNSTSHDEDVPESPTNAGSIAESPASPTYDAPPHLQLSPNDFVIASDELLAEDIYVLPPSSVDAEGRVKITR